MANDISKDLDKLKSDVDALRNDMASLIDTIKDLGAEKGNEALARAETFGEQALGHAKDAEQRLSDEIGERPFLSLLAAFGFGVIVAKLLEDD